MKGGNAHGCMLGVHDRIDNVAFQMGLSEQIRAKVEYAGRVVLSDAEMTALVRTKTIHEVLITLAVLAGVTSAQVDVAILIVFGSFWIAGLIEAFGNPDRSKIVRAAVTQTIACLAGICAIVPIAIPSIF